MSLTFDWPARVISSSSSITDLVAFHAALRDAEDTETGAIYPVTHTWRALDLGGGAYFFAADLINGWALKFPAPGNYQIVGNLNGAIVPVAGVYVERKTSAAYATSAVGGSGPSAAQVAAAVWAEMVEGGFSAAALLRLIAAEAAGDATGLDGATTTFKGVDGATVRITGQVAGGSRTITQRDGG